MAKICTSLEQSQKLIELGIDVNTADMWYQYIGDSFKDGITKPLYFPMIMRDDPTEKDIPAWSVPALMELIQDDIKVEKTLFDQSDMFTYSIIGDGYEYRSHEHECLLDAAFEFVCWLLENKKI